MYRKFCLSLVVVVWVGGLTWNDQKTCEQSPPVNTSLKTGCLFSQSSQMVSVHAHTENNPTSFRSVKVTPVKAAQITLITVHSAPFSLLCSIIHICLWEEDTMNNNGILRLKKTDYHTQKSALQQFPVSQAIVRKRTIPTEWPPHVSEVSAKFADRGCRVISATDPHGH
jgi:hypothetical protein